MSQHRLGLCGLAILLIEQNIEITLDYQDLINGFSPVNTRKDFTSKHYYKLYKRCVLKLLKLKLMYSRLSI